MKKRRPDKWFSILSNIDGAEGYHLGVMGLSSQAFHVYVYSMAYVARGDYPHVHGGLPRMVLRRNSKKVIAELLDAGLWTQGTCWPHQPCYHITHEGKLWRRGAPPMARRPIPAKVRASVFERDGYMCVVCEETDELSIDHIWPYSKGGGEDLDNLRTLCRPCNSRKGARTDGS